MLLRIDNISQHGICPIPLNIIPIIGWSWHLYIHVNCSHMLYLANDVTHTEYVVKYLIEK